MAGDEYHHGDLRRALLDAAERMVTREGAAKVSLRGIARAAGVSAAAPYHHFDGRESLLAGVAARGFSTLGEAMEQGAGAAVEEGPLARLQAAGAAYVAFACDHPGVYRLMFSGLLADRARFPDLKAEADRTFAVLTTLLVSDATTGRAERLHHLALSAWSTVHGLASLVIEGLLDEEMDSLGAEELTREVTTVLGQGLKAYGSPS